MPSEHDEPGRRPPTPEQREKLRKRVEAIKMWKLTQTLDLDEKTAAKIFPLMHKYDKKRADVQHSVRESIRELKETLRSHDDSRLSAILQNLENYHRKLKEMEEEEWKDLKSILSIEQQAKLVLFKMNFEREIRKIIAQTKHKRKDRFRRDAPERPLTPESQ
jgi:hypothetical protein